MSFKQQIKVYITAKREHAEKIRKVISMLDGIHVNSRWLWMDKLGERPVTHYFTENKDDAKLAHFIVFYVEPGDHLKMSLLELGHAMAYDKEIFIATDRELDHPDGWDFPHLPHKDLDPWVGLENVKITGTLEQTFAFIKKQVHGHDPITKAGKVDIK